MPLTQYPIAGSLRDALDTGPSAFAEVLFVPIGSHDSRVEDDNALLGAIGPIRAQDLPDPYLLDEGLWRVEISTRAKTSSWRPVFQPIRVEWDHDSATTWAEIVAGAVTPVPLTPTIPQQVDSQLDTLLPPKVADPSDPVGAALSATYAPVENTAYAAATLTGALATGAGDVTILSLSDSTWNATDEAMSLAMDDLAGDWPAYGLKYAAWDDATKTWPALTTRGTGTGPYFIKAYNGGVSGETFSYVLPNLKAMVTDLQPHLILINYGHNEGGTNNAPEQFRDEIVRLVEVVRAVSPLSAILVSSQNPRYDAGTTPGIVEMRTDVARRTCQLLGVGFIDGFRAFRDTGNPAAYVSSVDGLHPTTSGATNGSRVWADAIGQALRARPYGSPTPQPPSSLTVPAPNMIANGDFAAFTAASPDGWVLTNCTTTKNTTAGQYENKNGWSVNIVPTGAGQSSIYYPLPHRLLTADGGQWVSAAARIWIPAGSHVNSGRIGINDGITRTSRGSAQASEQGGWKWETFSRQIQSTATFARVYVYGSGNTSSTTDVVTVDRVWVGRGLLPHDAQ